MIGKELIESIKSLDSSVEFDEEIQIFTIGNIDNWLDVARGLKEQYEFKDHANLLKLLFGIDVLL